MSNGFGTCFVDDGSVLEPIVDVRHGTAEIAEVSKSPTGSLRFNSGKPEISQLDPRFLIALADLITRSAKKYGKYNWAEGQEFHTPFDSCMRHMLSFMSGEDLDKESNMSHLLHSAANIMILWTSQQKNNKELDTRFNWGLKNE